MCDINVQKNLREKEKKLLEKLNIYTKENVAIAFSGGVDSSLLLKLLCMQAQKNNTKVFAYTIHTLLHPIEDLEITKKLSMEYGAVYKVITVDELKEAGIESNPIDRCYLCKKCMFNKLIKEANSNGIKIIVDGTNLDDTKEYRPGIKAIREIGVKSPLQELNITKLEVRSLAKAYNIIVSNRPSTPCMATRFPYNTVLTKNNLENVEKIENYIKKYGFYNVRARIHQNIVRIEVDEKYFLKVLEHKKEITNYIKNAGYDYAVLDLAGFTSGSFDKLQSKN